MTDTDSLFYEIRADDVYEDLFGENSKCKDYFDTSNFTKTIHTTQRKIRK